MRLSARFPFLPHLKSDRKKVLNALSVFKLEASSGASLSDVGRSFWGLVLPHISCL